MLLLGGDGLNFDQRTLGQRTDLHRAARGALGCEILRVHGVYRGERTHVGEENGGLDHILHRAARAGEDGLEVFEGLLGLLLHTAGDERAGGGVERELAGDKYEAACFDGLRIGTDGAGRRGGGNDSFHWKQPPVI